jgi:2-polyprenyl-6-methoxyphenol hydroxylase-like FAD-dependent oxidoreductase
VSGAAVIVVGAGPVGLSMALELGLRGHQVVVLEKGDGRVDHPRAGGISIRTMEFCRRWGILDDVRNCGFPADYPLDIVFSTGLDGYELIRETYPSIGDMPVPLESPERRQRCPQMWFDPILMRAATRLPNVQLHLNTQVDEVAETDSGVTVRTSSTAGGAISNWAARYVVACDGATSTVRTALGIPMSGIPLLNYSVGVFFRSPGLLDLVDQKPAARFIFVSPDGPVGNLTVVDGRELWRFTFIAGTERLDLDNIDINAIMRDVLGPKAEFEILSIAPWRRSQLVADRYRAGRVFLAGDSAHTMSPTGGFGSNTGIGEAVDLGWKLDAVLRGWGGERLLDSYEAERRPIAIRNSDAATRNFGGWYSKNDLSGLLESTAAGERLRREVGEELLAGTRAEWESKGVILGYRYANSPICVSDGSPEPADEYRTYEPTNRAGHRAPHIWLAENTSTLDLFGEGFVLLDRGLADDSDAHLQQEAARRNIPLRRAPLPVTANSRYPTRFTLVRPDGHVAWRGEKIPAETRHLLAVVSGHRDI